MSEYLYEVARRLIGFDTVSSNSDLPAVEYLADELRAAGFNVTVQRIELDGVAQANLVASAGPARPGGLMISGHVDTVPYAGQPRWSREPLRMEVADERIYGRGMSDMKGFLAQCLDAARRLDRSALRRPLVFVFTASEEVGCLGAERVAPELEGLLGSSQVPRHCWIGEPTSWRVCHAHKSIVGFDVVVRGTGGHSGMPAAGVNAIAVMGKVIGALGAYQEERQRSPGAGSVETFPEAPFDVVNFGTIHGGLASNIIAEECRMAINYRSLPETDPLEMYREIERRLSLIDCHDFAGGDRRASIELGKPLIVPPLLAPRGTALEAALFEVTGNNTSEGALFATDGGWFSQAGITSLVCGPGDLDEAHQPNEFIGRDAFEGGTDMILRVISRMCFAADAT